MKLYKIKECYVPYLIGKVFLVVRESKKSDCWAGRIIDKEGITSQGLFTIPKADLEPLEDA